VDWLRGDWFADAQAHAHDAEDAVIPLMTLAT